MTHNHHRLGHSGMTFGCILSNEAWHNSNKEVIINYLIDTIPNVFSFSYDEEPLYNLLASWLVISNKCQSLLSINHGNFWFNFNSMNVLDSCAHHSAFTMSWILSRNVLISQLIIRSASIIKAFQECNDGSSSHECL